MSKFNKILAEIVEVTPPEEPLRTMLIDYHTEMLQMHHRKAEDHNNQRKDPKLNDAYKIAHRTMRDIHDDRANLHYEKKRALEY